MLREKTVFARKIIDYYAEKGVECSVVDEHLSLLVTLSSGDRTHEFRYGNRAFAGFHHCKKFYAALEREFSKLRTDLPAPAQVPNGRLKPKQRDREEAGEEAWANAN
ncbi:MAG: hypothetical protein WCW52_04445 [Elusimicrobiales bacterium]|jgi:hypothetical protein